MGREILFSTWPSVWRGRPHSLSLDTFPAVDCSATGVTLKKSTIPHLHAGAVVFAA